MNRKFKKGMTLVEIMAAVATGAFVVLAAGMIMTFGQQSWNKEWKRACLERDVFCIMTEITQPLKEASSVTIDANSITIYNGAEQTEFRVSNGQELEKRYEGGSWIDLTDKLYSATFTQPSSKTVTINITLEEDGIQASSISTVMMRNLP